MKDRSYSVLKVKNGKGEILLSNIAKDLSRYGLKCWGVTRGIQRINRRLRKEPGKPLADERGDLHKL